MNGYMHVVEIERPVRRKPLPSSATRAAMYPSRAWLTSWLGWVKSRAYLTGCPSLEGNSFETPCVHGIAEFFAPDQVFVYACPNFLHCIRWRLLPLFISPGLKSAQRPTSSLIPLEVLGLNAIWSFSLQPPSDSKFQSSRCCTRRIVIVLSRRCPSDSAGIATCCRRRAFAKTSKSSFPHNRPPATRLRQCRTVPGLITNVFGQQPVPSRRFRNSDSGWRGAVISPVHEFFAFSWLPFQI